MVIRIYTVSIYNSNIIKGCVVHYFLQCFNIYPVRIHRLFVQMGNGTDAVLRADKQILNSLRSLSRCILYILCVSGYRHPAVRSQVSCKTGDNKNQQNNCWDYSFPDRLFSTHKVYHLQDQNHDRIPDYDLQLFIFLTWAFCFVRMAIFSYTSFFAPYYTRLFRDQQES